MHQVEFFFFSAAERKNWFLTQTNIFSLLTWEQCYSVKLSGGVCLHTADILTSPPHLTSLMISRQRDSLAFSEQLQKPKPSLSASTPSASTPSGSSRSDSTLPYSALCFHTLLLCTLWFYTLLSPAAAPDCPPSWHYLQLQLWNFNLIYFLISPELYPPNFSSSLRKKNKKIFNVSYSLKARCLNNSLGF